MATIRAVLFDYGLVLTGPPGPAAWERLKHVFGASEPSFDAAYWKFRDEYDRGTLNAPTYWAAVADTLGQRLAEPQLRELIAADIVLWTQVNQPVVDWATQLHRNGYKTGILSNIGDAMEFGVLETCPWLHDFSSLTFSHREGFIKPESAIYAIAAEALDTPPAKILFIDDKAVNVEGARQAGMHAVRYVNHEQFLVLMAAQGFAYLLDDKPLLSPSHNDAV